MPSPGRLLAGLFAWIVAVGLGATLVDVVYAAQPSFDPTARTEVGDVLLWVSGLSVLAGIAALATAGGRERSRILFLASLVVVTVGLLALPVLSGAVTTMEEATGLRLGPALRSGMGGLASLLAFGGLWEAWRPEPIR